MDADNVRNLRCHRVARSVWDQRGWSGVAIEERVGPWLASLAGMAMLIYGASRRSWHGTQFVLGGAGLLTCAAAGLCNPRHAAVRWRRLSPPIADRITTESMDSFPASDAPSSNAIALSAVWRCAP